MNSRCKICKKTPSTLVPGSTREVKKETEWDRCCDTRGIAMASHNYVTAVELTSVLRFIYDDLEFRFDSKAYRLERFSLNYRK